jgi:hypothetical protein
MQLKIFWGTIGKGYVHPRKPIILYKVFMANCYVSNFPFMPIGAFEAQFFTTRWNT